MVLDEGHHAGGVGVEVVIDERAVEAVQTIPPGVGLFVLGLIELVEEGEVHHGLQVGVVCRELGVFLPGGGIGGLCHPGLSHGVEVGVFLVELLHPLGHRVGIGVGIGVHADAVDADGLNPPDGVLDEVAHQVGVMLVEVGHGGHEPAFDGLLHIDLRGVGIDDGCQLVGGLQIGRFCGL